MSEQVFVDVPETVATEMRDSLRAALAAKQLTQVVGAQLVPLINEALKSSGTSYKELFAPGVKPSLRLFVETWLRDVVLPTARKQGADYFYQVATSVDLAAKLQPTEGELWRTFVSVKPTQKLVYDDESRSVRVMALDADVDPKLVIASVAVGEHKQMCENFAARLREDGMAPAGIDDLLQTYSAESYPAWLRLLRANNPPLDSQWGEFRHNQIVQLFARRLEGAGASPDAVEQIKLELRRAYEATTSRGHVAKTVVPATPVSAEARAPAEDKARALLHSVIDRATYEELREIRIPFGLVIDLINTTR